MTTETGDTNADGDTNASSGGANSAVPAIPSASIDKSANKDTDKSTDKSAVTEKPTENLVPKQDGDTEWGTHPDVAIAGIQSIMKDGGFTELESDAIFQKAVESGNLADINESALVSKLGAAKAALVMAGAKDYYTRVYQKDEATVKAVHSIFGGQDNFDVVAKWAGTKESSDPEFAATLDEFRSMFDKGGISATSAGRELQRMYNEDSDTSSLQNTMQQGDSKANAASTGDLTRAEYIKEIKEAYDTNNTALIDSLRNRRRETTKKDRLRG